ncbi:MAG TPA: hypothetical protein VNB90_00640 [Cytophagaceae bacterium]|nr:hypothetical protein [Cytophagaceae bacterium]
MKKIFFSASLLLCLVTQSSFAQYETYPAIFGRQTMYGGTARYTAISGAATALGADLGAASVNPAGLGMYRKSEFSFSPIFGFSGSNTSFLNEDMRDKKGSFSIGNLGIAICGAKSDLDKSDWRGGTFSFGVTRTNSFHNRISFSGTDPNSSITDNFVEQANGTPENTLLSENPNDPNGSGIVDLAGLAYWSYLINSVAPGTNSTQYTNYKTTEIFKKDATYTTKGAQYQWNIAYGANYKDKLYLGGVLGINTINFREDLTYTETVDDSYTANGTDMFNNMTFDDYNRIKGTGVNLKLGYIYKVVDAWRIGTTITTPTYYWMNQQYNSDVTAVYPPYLVADDSITPLGTQSQSTNTGYFKFNYTTPLKLAIGTSVFLGKMGFISGDIEYVPYQLSDLSGRNSSDDKYLRPYNKIITNTYKNIVNFRLGAELRFNIVSVRLGSAYLPNPYNYSDHVNRDMAQFSGGLGIRLQDVYFDLGVVNTRYASSYQPYTLSNTYDQYTGQKIVPPTAVSKNSLTNVVLTMGFYFE